MGIYVIGIGIGKGFFHSHYSIGVGIGVNCIAKGISTVDGGCPTIHKLVEGDFFACIRQLILAACSRYHAAVGLQVFGESTRMALTHYHIDEPGIHIRQHIGQLIAVKTLKLPKAYIRAVGGSIQTAVVYHIYEQMVVLGQTVGKGPQYAAYIGLRG